MVININVRFPLKGDSGGSLFQKYNGSWYALGVVSFGHLFCGGEGIPAVYTRVSKFLQWIKNETDDSPRCDDGRELAVEPNFSGESFCNKFYHVWFVNFKNILITKKNLSVSNIS